MQRVADKDDVAQATRLIARLYESFDNGATPPCQGLQLVRDCGCLLLRHLALTRFGSGSQQRDPVRTPSVRGDGQHDTEDDEPEHSLRWSDVDSETLFTLRAMLQRRCEAEATKVISTRGFCTGLSGWGAGPFSGWQPDRLISRLKRSAPKKTALEVPEGSSEFIAGLAAQPPPKTREPRAGSTISTTNCQLINNQSPLLEMIRNAKPNTPIYRSKDIWPSTVVGDLGEAAVRVIEASSSRVCQCPHR